MEKRTAVVTGGAGDIGAHICETLLRANYRVVSLDITESLVKGVESRLCSVADKGDVITALRGYEVDVLINAAGITRDIFLHRMTDDDWHRVIDINLTGAYNVTSVVLRGMRDRKYGRIVNIGSINGTRGQFGQCNYAASKAGIHGFTMSLAQEGAAKNVIVNTVSPGYIDTKMTKKIPEEVAGQILAMIPARRMGVPADVTRAVMFLIHEDNTYITGVNLHVNGGLYTSF